MSAAKEFRGRVVMFLQVRTIQEYLSRLGRRRLAIRAARFGPETDLRFTARDEINKRGNRADEKCEGALREQQEFLCVPRHSFSMT